MSRTIWQNRDHQNGSKSSIKFEHREQYHRGSLKVRLEFQTYIWQQFLREENDPLKYRHEKIYPTIEFGNKRNLESLS